MIVSGARGGWNERGYRAVHRRQLIAPRHVCGGPRLVDEDQAIGVESGLTANEHAPGLGDIRAVLARPHAGSFFERQVLGTQKPVHRAQSDGDPAPGRKRTADLPQGQTLIWRSSTATNGSPHMADFVQLGRCCRKGWTMWQATEALSSALGQYSRYRVCRTRASPRVNRAGLP